MTDQVDSLLIDVRSYADLVSAALTRKQEVVTIEQGLLFERLGERRVDQQAPRHRQICERNSWRADPPQKSAERRVEIRVGQYASAAQLN